MEFNFESHRTLVITGYRFAYYLLFLVDGVFESGHEYSPDVHSMNVQMNIQFSRYFRCHDGESFDLQNI